MSREERHEPLLEAAWCLARAEGSDALTQARVAEEAGVSKPVVYDHFTTRHGLLAALYEDFDRRQTAIIDANMAAAGDDLQAKADAGRGRCYFQCYRERRYHPYAGGTGAGRAGADDG